VPLLNLKDCHNLTPSGSNHMWYRLSLLFVVVVVVLASVLGCDQYSSGQAKVVASPVTTAAAPAKEVCTVDQLIVAIAYKESSGCDVAIGDRALRNKAYGYLQIRQPVCDDVNRRFGTQYCATDCQGNRTLSIDVFHKYQSIYATKERLGREPTAEDMARIWNGGPDGWHKSSTVTYWQQVRSHLK